LRKARSIWEGRVTLATAAKTTNRDKAAAVYELVKDWFLYYGKYRDAGTKKAFESRKGNVGLHYLKMEGNT
jgi:hypothetical protein